MIVKSWLCIIDPTRGCSFRELFIVRGKSLTNIERKISDLEHYISYAQRRYWPGTCQENWLITLAFDWCLMVPFRAPTPCKYRKSTLPDTEITMGRCSPHLWEIHCFQRIIRFEPAESLNGLKSFLSFSGFNYHNNRLRNWSTCLTTVTGKPTFDPLTRIRITSRCQITNNPE